MITLINGDCLEEMKKIPDGSIDLVLSDPPYGTTACKWDTVIPFEPMWEQLKRVTKKNGAIVLFGSQPFTSALVMSNPKMFKYEWVWNKNKGSNIMLVKKQPLKIHENVLVFGGQNYNPQKTKVDGKVRKQNEEVKIKKCQNRDDGAVSPKKTVKYADDYNPQERYPVSIQYFPNHREKEQVFHPTQKPVDLMEYLIKTYTNEGETVLDFTMGSGTTGVACKNLNRNFIGIELDRDYYEIAKKRISDQSELDQPTPLPESDKTK